MNQTRFLKLQVVTDKAEVNTEYHKQNIQNVRSGETG